MNIRIVAIRLLNVVTTPYNIVKNSIIKPKKQTWKKPIKLNIGCGTNYINEWVNIDCDNKNRVDLLINFKDVKKYFENETVDEIILYHSISYLNLWEARVLLSDFYELLVEGGILVLEFPDTVKCAKMVIDAGHDYDKYVDSIRPFYAFDFDQIKKKKHYTPYSFGWSGAFLKKELEQLGYKNIKVLNPETHDNRHWRDTRIEAEK